MTSSTMTTTTLNTSNLRQSARQTRSNPTRNSKTTGRALGGPSSLRGAGVDTAQNPDRPHGFYPAITHFTDAITALPREFRRHTSLLKEVDAKAWAPEENLQHLLVAASFSPPMRLQPLHTVAGSTMVHIDTNNSPAETDPPTATSFTDQASQSSTQPLDAAADFSRRKLFFNLRYSLTEILGTVDEKNHVITNANDELQRQLGRLETILPYVEGEISDEARCGSLTHWAYKDLNPRKSGPTAIERPRREVAATNHAVAALLGDPDVASRSESRREAMLARKQRHVHVDSDFDDGRTHARKPNGNSKGKRVEGESSLGLGITSAAGPGPAKRRKVEKPAPGGNAMERALSGALTSTGGRPMSRETSQTEGGKKRSRAPHNPSATGRKRNNTAASTAGSPSLASSPVAGTFNNPREIPRSSPVPSSIQRPQSSRARQNSAQTIADARQRPSSSASNRPANGNALSTTTTEMHNTASSGKSALDTKITAKEANGKGDTELQGDLRRETSLSGKGGDKSMKREDTDVNGNSMRNIDLPTTITRGKSSKTSTPVVSTFSEAQRSRPSRFAEPPPKRSHKKGAGLAAQQQLIAAAAEDEDSSMQGDEEDDEAEPRYCYCNGVSYGEMVACDMENCPREWFHLECVGLNKAPKANTKWYCDDCKENAKKGKAGNGGK